MKENRRASSRVTVFLLLLAVTALCIIAGEGRAAVAAQGPVLMAEVMARHVVRDNGDGTYVCAAGCRPPYYCCTGWPPPTEP